MCRPHQNCFKIKSKWFDDKDMQLKPNSFSYDREFRAGRSGASAVSTVLALKCAVPAAIGCVRAKTGGAPPSAVEFLLELLRSNDNHTNKYADGEYVASVVDALAKALVSSPQQGPEAGESGGSGGVDSGSNLEVAVWELKRYLGYDRIARSHNGCVAAACIKALCALELRGLSGRVRCSPPVAPHLLSRVPSPEHAFRPA